MALGNKPFLIVPGQHPGTQPNHTLPEPTNSRRTSGMSVNAVLRSDVPLKASLAI